MLELTKKNQSSDKKH